MVDKTRFTDSKVETPALDAASGTVDNKEIVGRKSSTSGDVSFGDWETVSESRPAELFLRGRAETNGSTNAKIIVEIDESGGTNSDYLLVLVEAHTSLGSGAQVVNSRTVPLGPGWSYKVINDFDPTGNNTFELERILIN